MKTLNKTSLLLENRRLSHENTLLNLAVHDLLARDKVSWFHRGNIMLGVSRENGAHGGIVIERQQINEGKGFEFTGVHYWEAYRERVRNQTFSHTDAMGMALRQVCEDVARYVSLQQAEFFAPLVAAAVQK